MAQVGAWCTRMRPACASWDLAQGPLHQNSPHACRPSSIPPTAKLTTAGQQALARAGTYQAHGIIKLVVLQSHRHPPSLHPQPTACPSRPRRHPQLCHSSARTPSEASESSNGCRDGLGLRGTEADSRAQKSKRKGRQLTPAPAWYTMGEPWGPHPHSSTISSASCTSARGREASSEGAAMPTATMQQVVRPTPRWSAHSRSREKQIKSRRGEKDRARGGGSLEDAVGRRAQAPDER